MKKKLRCLITAAIAALVLSSLPSCRGGGGSSAPPFPGKTMGGAGSDIGRSVQQTPDGGFIIAGSTSSFGAGGSDVYLVKTDSSGSLEWASTFGGANDDYGYSVRRTSDGGFIIAGSTNSLGAGGSDLYLIKTDPSGGLVWEKTFGGPGDDYGYSVLEIPEGYAAVGTAAGASDASDLLLITTDPSGNVLWEKTFGGPAPYPGGTTDTWLVEGYSIQQTSDGGFILTGRAESLSLLAGLPFVGLFGFDVYLIKTDAAGNRLWETTLGGAGDQGGNSVLQTSDGGYLVVGYDELGGVLVDVYLVKTDPSGNQVWDATFGEGGTDAGHFVRQTSDGGYIITGVNSANNSDVFLIKTDSYGNPAWERTFGAAGADSGSAVEQTADGGYVIAGTTESGGAGGSDIWLLRTDEAGNAQ